jgi:dTDP-glucose 4,6-dehydratase
MDESFKTNLELAAKYPDAKRAIAGASKELITYVTDRAGHDQRYAINPTKSNTELGYVPQESFETGIRKTIQWYLESNAWWTPLLK